RSTSIRIFHPAPLMVSGNAKASSWYIRAKVLVARARLRLTTGISCRSASRSSNTAAGSLVLTTRNLGRAIAAGPTLGPMQCPTADQVLDPEPHRLPLGVRLAHIAKALRPAHLRGNLDGDFKSGDHPARPQHDLRHGGDGIVELVEWSRDPESVVHR